MLKVFIGWILGNYAPRSNYFVYLTHTLPFIICSIVKKWGSLGHLSLLSFSKKITCIILVLCWVQTLCREYQLTVKQVRYVLFINNGDINESLEWLRTSGERNGKTVRPFTLKSFTVKIQLSCNKFLLWYAIYFE